MLDHAKLSSLVRIELELELRTGLHIGSGKSRGMLTSDQPVLRNADGLPYVPGSSLRGVLRSGIESLLRSVDDRERGLWACDPFAATNKEGEGFDIGKVDKKIREDGRQIVQAAENSACTAQRLFGASGYASRIWIGDGEVHGEAQSEWSTDVRDGVGLNRDLRRAQTGVKFDYEFVRAGARFDVQIGTKNLEDWELGLLAEGLILLDEGQLRLGGLGARGLGLVRVHVKRIVQQSAADVLKRRQNELPIGSSLDETFDKWIQALGSRLDRS